MYEYINNVISVFSMYFLRFFFKINMINSDETEFRYMKQVCMIWAVVNIKDGRK